MGLQLSITQHLVVLFHKNLDQLKLELEQYSTESSLWVVPEGISNCAGNLALHLVGNLNHFIGATIARTGYKRQRDLEFTQKHIPLAVILSSIDDTKEMITQSLTDLSVSDLEKEYRRNPLEDYMTTEYFLLHLLSHLSYHLGQINYHRRLLI